MTIGIAAVCDWGRYIILASDQMISTEDYAGEGTIKLWSIHRDWGLVYAGNDLAHISPIYERARDKLNPSASVSAENVTNAMLEAYRAEIGEKVNAYLSPLLSPFSLQPSDFWQHGKDKLGETLFATHHQHIMNVDLECEFLVAGYDMRPDRQKAHVVGIVNPGKSVNEDTTGFSAIGSGAAVAINMLLFHSFNNRMDLVPALYHVCAAKFMTEQPGIGKTTDVVVLQRDGEGGKVQAHSLTPLFVREIRECWCEEGKPRFPPCAEVIVPDGMKDTATRYLKIPL